MSLLKPLPFFHVSHQQHQTWCRCCPDAVLWFAEVKTLTHHIYKGRIEYKLEKKNQWEKKVLYLCCVPSALTLPPQQHQLWCFHFWYNLTMLPLFWYQDDNGNGNRFCNCGDISFIFSSCFLCTKRVSSQFFHYVNCISYCKHVNVIMAAYNPCVYPVWKWYHLKMPFTFMCCLIKFVHCTNKLDCLG